MRCVFVGMRRLIAEMPRINNIELPEYNIIS